MHQNRRPTTKNSIAVLS